MSKKHPGVQPWYREHMQPGKRRKPGADAVAAEPVADARKPPGWRGRKATREAASQAKADAGGKPDAKAPAPDTVARPAAGAKPAGAKPAGAKPAGAKHGARNGAPHDPAKAGTHITPHGGRAAAKAAPSAKAGGKPAPVVVEAAHKVMLDGEGRPYISLVQFLKTIAAFDTGGAGKHAIRAGGILVNGAEELRPGRKLHAGDVVTVAGAEHPVAL